jgi:hypothetical protein
METSVARKIHALRLIDHVGGYGVMYCGLRGYRTRVDQDIASAICLETVADRDLFVDRDPKGVTCARCRQAMK